MERIEIIDATEDTVAFYDGVDNNLYFTHRGSNFDALRAPGTFIRDIFSDIIISVSNVAGPQRIITSTQFVNRVLEQNPNCNVIHTGHSLGGSVANYHATINGTKSVSFNPGGSLLNLLAPIQLINNPDIENHIINGDPISSTRIDIGKRYVYNSVSCFPFSNHSLSNFLCWMENYEE